MSVSWDDLLAQRISVSEAAPLFSATGTVLDDLLTTAPKATEQILAILFKHLDRATDANTWTSLSTALTNYLGEAAPLILWVVRADQAARLHEAELRVSPPAARLLRTIVGLYGSELALAYTRWRELPNDWMTVHRDVFYDEIEKRYLLRVSIDKLNGETAVIEARPGSFLRLITTLVRTARQVSDPTAFDRGSVDAFNTEIGQLLGLLAKPQDQAAPAP